MLAARVVVSPKTAGCPNRPAKQQTMRRAASLPLGPWSRPPSLLRFRMYIRPYFPAPTSRFG